MSTRRQNTPWRVLFPALLAAYYCARGCEARPWSYDYEREIPTATVAPAPDTVKLVPLTPTPFKFRQSFVEKKLRKRVFYPDNVCGFIGGDVGLPATCSQGSACIWDTAHGVVGCTPTAGSGSMAVYTSCTEDDDDDEDNNRNPFVNYCTGNDECYRNTYEAVSGQRFFQFGCGSSEWATTVLTQPISVPGQSARVVLTSIDMGSSQGPSSSSSSSSSSLTSREPPSSTDPPPPDTTSNSESTTSDETSTTGGGGESPSPSGDPTTSGSEQSTTSGGTGPTNGTGSSTPIPGGDSGTDTGAIAGGVVGGVAGLALIAGLLFLLKRRRNREKNRRISEASLTSSGPHDMGSEYEPKELDATGPELPSELPGDTTLAGPSKVQEPVELPGSEPVGPGYGETKGMVAEKGIDREPAVNPSTISAADKRV